MLDINITDQLYLCMQCFEQVRWFMSDIKGRSFHNDIRKWCISNNDITMEYVNVCVSGIRYNYLHLFLSLRCVCLCISGYCFFHAFIEGECVGVRQGQKCRSVLKSQQPYSVCWRNTVVEWRKVFRTPKSCPHSFCGALSVSLLPPKWPTVCRSNDRAPS